MTRIRYFELTLAFVIAVTSLWHGIVMWWLYRAVVLALGGD